MSSGRPGAGAFERVYSLIVVFKGVDGLLELVAGIVLLVAPTAAGDVLTAIATELAEGSSPVRQAAARSIGSASGAASTALAVFFLVHGVVKLVTVYCLLRRAVRWYPWALAALIALLILQLVDLITAPGVGAVLLSVLDVLVIALVAWEYHRLRRVMSREPDRATGVQPTTADVEVEGR